MDTEATDDKRIGSLDRLEPRGAGGSIRVLLLEGDPSYADLIARELNKLDGEIALQRVDTREDFEAALENFRADIVLLDYNQAAFDGIAALQMVRRRHPEIPAVMVTPTLGDEAAIDLLMAGARDNVLKSNLVRLVIAVHRSISVEAGIRARKSAERAVRASELRYRRLFEAAECGILILEGQSGVIVDANPFLTGRLGYSREELLGKTVWEIGLFEDQDASRKAFSELMTRGYSCDNDLKLRRKDGTSLEVECVSNAYDVDGQRVYQCNIHDISDRRRIEQALSESEARFRRLIENSSDVIGVIRADGTLGYVSPAIREVAGYEPDEVIGRPFLEMIHPDDLESARRVLFTLSACPGSRSQITLRLLHKDGGVRNTETVAQNLLDAAGINGIVMSTRDVTERSRAHEALRAAEKRYSDLFGATRDAILTLNPKSGEILAANKAAVTLYGAKDVAELISRTPWEISPERQPDGRKSAEKAMEMIGAAVRMGSLMFEWTHQLPRGAEFPADVLLTKVVTDGQVLLYATLRDISERKRTEQDRAFNAAVLAAIQQASPDGILLVDQRERIVSYNPRFAEIWAIPPELLAAGLVAPVLQAVASRTADEPAFVARITKLYADRDARSQDEIRLKDGRVLDRITGPVKLADGTYIGRVWFFRDVSERARIQEQLQTVHERLQSATEGAAAGVWEIDWETQKMKWDATTRELYALSGTDPDPDVGSWLARVHGDDRSSIREKLSAAAADEADRFDAEFRVPLPDGTVRWLRSFGRIFRDRYGVALRATGICLDITAAKRIEADKDRAEASLAASERRFRAMIENAGDIILVADSRALLTYVSPSIEAVAGYTPGEMLGHSILEYVDPAGREALKAKYAAIAAQPNLIDRNERPYLHKGGEQRIYEVVSSNLLHDPAVAGIVVNLRDISERKEAEARLHAVTGAAMDAVILVDNEGKLAFWNDAAERILGYKSAEIIGKDFHSLLAPARYLEAFHAGFAAFRATGRGPAVGKTTELAARRQDGTEIPVELSLASVILKGKWNAVGILRDISARKVQEEALARVNRTLKTLSACNSVVVHATTEQQLLQDMCRTVVEIGGFKAAWIGFAQQDREKSVRPVAWAGATENYVGQLDINWDDTERGRGPVGRCIRTAAPQVIHDIEADPLMAPWHTLTEEHGYLSSLTLPLTGPAGVFGALMIDAGERDAFGANELELLSEMASDLSYGIMALRTVAAHAEGLHRLELSMEGTIHALAGMVETRDPYTAGHQRRVTALAVAIAREMDLSDHAVRGLELAATIHDIGKINVPAEILAKPGKLTPIEFELIKTHPETGHEILKDVQFPWPVAEIIRQHHERSDGSGYPRGLRSEQILPEAKILAVADVAEAMSSHRPYRPGKGVGAALEEIARGRGTVFDAAVVDACLRLFHERGYKIPE